jgi:predicted PurR-regulated permease PerM
MTDEKSLPRNSLGFLLGLAALLAVLVAWLIKPFLEAIFLAVILSFTFQPLFSMVRRRVRGDSAASLLTLVLIVLLVLTPMIVLGLAVSRETGDFVRGLNARAAGEGGVVHYLGRIADRPLAWISGRTGVPTAELEAQAAAKLQSAAGALAGGAGRLASDLAATIGTIVIALITLFFLFAEGKGIREGTYQWLPMRRERIDELIRVLGDSIVANVYSMAAVGIVQGALTGIGFFIAGLASPLMWGLVAGVFSLIPLVGAGLVWLPGVVVLVARESYGMAIFLAAWGALLVANADNVIRPWVLAGRTNVNTMVLLFALLGGMHAFGFMGLFAGPVIVSVAASVFRILREEFSEPAA